MKTTLYFLPTDGALDGTAAEQLLCRVSPARRCRIARLRRDTDRKNALLAALLVRAAACEALGLANTDLSFALADGKPYLCGAEHFHFSLSHTEGAVCAAVCAAPCGVDVERLRNAPRGVTKRFFTEAERRYAEASDTHFFEIWTRKEAYFKRFGGSLADTLTAVDLLSPAAADESRVFDFGTHIAALSAENAADAEVRSLDLDAFVSHALAVLAPLD